jgi:protein TonB
MLPRLVIALARLVLFIVDQSGNVESAMALKADDVRFADAAVEAVSKWRFSPATRNGEPVKCRMQAPIVFAAK